VGDAGYYKDPITAQGISDAFRDAEFIAEALDAGFTGHQALAEALAAYQRQRDDAAAPGFATTLQFAQMAPPTPEMQQLFGALRHNRAQVGQLFGTIAGSVHPAAFFAPENLGQIMAAA
jgi:2-polyprenyl-6-methoxyphenol hydroxylase-like FAD-dependent oxidoreductase